MQTNRIPVFEDKSAAGMRAWMKKMCDGGLLFHPDDDPATIIHVKSGEPLFDEIECGNLTVVIGEMFALHGERVYDEGHRLLWRRLMRISRRSSANRSAQQLH